MTEDVLKIFSEPTAGWFAETFGKATKVQEEAWPAIAAGKPVLVSAPRVPVKRCPHFWFLLTG